MQKPKRFVDVLRNLDMYIACLALGVLIAITILGVAMRYIVNRPIYWMEEVQLWCFVWVTFLGACAVARSASHIAIDAITSLFPMSVRRSLGAFAVLVTIAALAFLGYYACYHVFQMYERERLTNILGIPYALIYLVVPLSCLIICLTSLRQLLENRTVRKTDYDMQKSEQA